MSEFRAGDMTYDVAVIGYGPTGVTAANLLGAMGLRVVVVERDAEIYARARAISTDEEVLRIWQRTGLADRLKQDMLAERPLDFVDARGKPFLSARPTRAGTGIRRRCSSTSRRWSASCATGSPATRTSRCCCGTSVCGCARTPRAWS